MNDDVLFDNGIYRVINTIEGDPVDWEDPLIKSICVALLKKEAPREYFFKRDLRKLYNNGLPHFFLDPKKGFDPSTKSDSNIFQLIETYKEDEGGNLRKFIGHLIADGVLSSDSVKLLKCKCDKLTLSSGNWCGHCDHRKTQEDRRFHLYYLPEEIKRIFNQPGTIIEGVIYHALKTLKDAEVFANVQLKYGEGKKKQELDLVVFNKNRERMVVVLSTIMPQDTGEKRQCGILIDNNISSLLVTTESEKATSGIIDLNNLSKYGKIDVFTSISKDDTFPDKILVKIKEHLKL